MTESQSQTRVSWSQTCRGTRWACTHALQAIQKAKVKATKRFWKSNVSCHSLAADCPLPHDYTLGYFFFFPSLASAVAPICRPGQVQTFNVGRGETAQIQCEVEGIPRDISYVWKFNTSVSEVLDMPSSIVKNNGTRSTIHFKPMTEHVIWTQFKCVGGWR